MTRTLLLACITLVAGAAIATGGTAEAAPYDCQNIARRVEVGAQPMRTAIADLSEQIRCPISIDAKTDGMRGGTLKGNMTPISAAVGLVKGTGLEAIQINQGIGIGRYEQDAFGARVADLNGKVTAAVRGGRITLARGATLRRQLASVTTSVRQVARQQGFVSAAEKASYRRTIDAVAKAVS